MGRLKSGCLGRPERSGSSSCGCSKRIPWFRATWLAGSERSEGKRYEDAAPWRLSTPMPDAARDTVVQPPVPGQGAGARVLRARRLGRHRDRRRLCRRRPHRRQQRAQLPHGRARAAARARGQRRAPRARARAGRGQRLEGAHRHQPELLDRVPRDVARAAARVRAEERHRHHAAGRLRRRAIPACRRSTSSATSSPSSPARKRRSRARPSGSSAV